MASERKTFYVTTPIYYTNRNLHIGHTYSTVAADALARYHRLKGYDTWFLTGTDEHGQNIERTARAAGQEPLPYINDIVASIKELWATLHISYDDFIRTTEPRHKERVQAIFQRLYDQGDIYKATYEGLYCTACEAYYTESQLGEGRICPDHGRPVEKFREESYFFRQSKYAERLLAHIEANPDFIQPTTRRNEVVSFIKQGLEDLCVSRTSFKWGIQVPFDPDHVIYVWIDALANYITALGWPDGELYKRFWPAQVHLIGKDILRFHAIIWPILLMALDLPLPKQVYGHGWVLVDGAKMSKTVGNVIDPVALVDKYGVDAVRYFLLREVPFGQDGNYNEEALIRRTNVDLANDLGNLLSRTTAMIERFSDGRIPAPVATADDGELSALAGEVVEQMEAALERLDLPQALASLWRLIGRANKYIDEKAPWNLAKLAREGATADAERARQQLHTVLYNLAETLRLSAVLLAPFLVETPEGMWRQLGLSGSPRAAGWDAGSVWGQLEPGITVQRGEPLFPRIELPPAEQADAVASSAAASAGKQAGTGGEQSEQIQISDFQRIDLRVAEIVSAAPVPGADRLLQLQIKIGDEERQLVAGIAQHYKPEELPGKQIVVVANLKPAKIRGVESRGMLLAATDADGKLALVSPERPVGSGAKVK